MRYGPVFRFIVSLWTSMTTFLNYPLVWKLFLYVASLFCGFSLVDKCIFRFLISLVFFFFFSNYGPHCAIVSNVMPMLDTVWKFQENFVKFVWFGNHKVKMIWKCVKEFENFPFIYILYHIT